MSMTVSSKEWDDALAGRYDEALHGFNKHRRGNINFDCHAAYARGHVLLCLRRYQEATEAFIEANEIASTSRLDKDIEFLNHLGGALWLAGDKNGAAQTWQRSVRGIVDGTIRYGDLAGGATQGLLLNYAASTMQRPDLKMEAEKYLKRLTKRNRIQYWPGPLALLVLGKVTWNQLLDTSFKDREIDRSSYRAVLGLLDQRRYIQALFQQATIKRNMHDAAETRRFMQACANVDNPHIEIEWYLARGEIELQ